MTLLEAKDKFAVQQGFKDWNDYNVFMFHTNVTPAKKQLAVDGAIELYVTSKVVDFKSSLRKEIEERIEELENDESEFSDEEVFFALRENRAFLILLDTCMPSVNKQNAQGSAS